MSKEQLVEMYIDWTEGRSDIKMSDWMCACWEAGFETEEIEKEAEDFFGEM